MEDFVYVFVKEAQVLFVQSALTEVIDYLIWFFKYLVLGDFEFLAVAGSFIIIEDSVVEILVAVASCNREKFLLQIKF